MQCTVVNSETHNWWKSREWESVECSAENGVSLSPSPEGSVTITEKGQEDLRRQNSGREIVSSRSNSTTDSWTHGGCGCLHKPYTFKSVRILAWSEELRIPHPWLRGHWQQVDPERELGTTMWCWEWNQSFLEKTKQNNNNAGSHNIQHIQGHRSRK